MILEAFFPSFKWECGIRTVINVCSRSFVHIKTDVTNVLCICVFMQFLFQDRMISMTLDRDNEVALQTMKLLILISKWALLSWFSKHPLDNFSWQELTSHTPQIHWWRAHSWRLQTALSVCLLVTAPPCGQCGRVGVLKVFKSELFEANKKKANDVCFYKVTSMKINVQKRLIDI